jgi:hypothetical protein
MKFWAALALLLFLCVASQAQVYYSGYPYLQPYYPGAYASPYYPQAYYPQLYGLETGSLVFTTNNESVDALTRQVQDLTDEVKMLQAQLATAQAQAEIRVPAPAPLPPPEPSTPMVFVFNNGGQIESHGYAVVGDTVWIITSSGSLRVARSDLNLAATERENLKRGIDVSGLGLR